VIRTELVAPIAELVRRHTLLATDPALEIYGSCFTGRGRKYKSDGLNKHPRGCKRRSDDAFWSDH